MNEVHNLLIGYELNKKGSQIAYFDRETGQPVSVPAKVGTGMYVFPTTLCKIQGKDVWHFGIEADYFSAQRGGIPVEHFFDCLENEEPLLIDGVYREPYELLAIYLKSSLALLGGRDVVKAITCLAITTEKLSAALSSNIKKACKAMGLESDRLVLQDAMQSFYSYAYSQKNDMKARDIALFVFDEDSVSYHGLSANKNTRPALIHPEQREAVTLSPIENQRDEDFYAYAYAVLEKRIFSSVYITGEGFDTAWAKKSVPYLCKSGRHVFQGQNLYVRGACYGAYDKAESRHLREQLYLGEDLILTNVGMEMLVKGSPSYVPLIQAGINYFDSDREIELITGSEDELTFVIAGMDGRGRKQMKMVLTELPKRPAGATRLAVNVHCSDA
ncbi:MAG: hypothetical protein KBS83_04485, partial [Lachnospiraceae bacterium]|nr:hypothetical protein [Candidatus Equihabitans merdae]